jgi:hypothetical protein
MKPTRFAKNYPKIILLVHIEIRHYNSSKMNFSKEYKTEDITKQSSKILNQIFSTQQISQKEILIFPKETQ